MKRVFADTYYFLAIINPNDRAHSQAMAFSRDFRTRRRDL